ncbi:efflux RND transporter periplasmic adaptor subunit [Amantichitinum ursilacus]|uniref:Toluene efflux pump periplasmic linker protein TtgD n=1 Tax=Amantichitinum ursilacus TaxID=857265 RepID=A0A0N1JU61_9NEIS|nr:efflux RND transporter periplasmic adaptor subunit [Amantichitinum ursilacus]KPC55422.1 Toluene efflux pump periplasmic linker protein TtgD precursor [Amantichitinum ursilacus]
MKPSLIRRVALRQRRSFVLPALAFMLAGALAACQRHEEPPAPPTLVVAMPAQSSTAQAGDALRYPVEVASRYTNAMSFRVAGKIIERKVRLGDRVRKGQLMARLDAVDAQKQVASAQAQLDAAAHKVVFTQQQLQRDQGQAQKNLIAANQLEQSQDNYTAAVAGSDQAAAQLLLAQNNLQYNTLVADHDGVITSENADTGAVVSAGQTIYNLAWSGDTDLYLDASERDLARIKVGQNATITFPALPGQHFAAKVREVAPAADAQSRTWRVKLTLVQPGDAVKFGMTGDAVLQPANSPASANADGGTFQLPATAIFHQGKDPAVWVVNGSNKLELRKVNVLRYDERSATVSGGIKNGEQVVQAGVHTVFAGQAVKPVKPLFAAEQAAEGAAQ